jgi:drug/metabolite transporter (DMT)-like permease
VRSRAVALTAALAALYLLWGSNYLTIKVAVQTLPPFTLLTLRWSLAGLLLFAFAVRRGERAADPLGPRQWLATLLLGTLLIGTGNGSLFFAEQYISSGLTALLAGTMPIWAAIWAALMYRRGIAPLTLAGFALGIGGLVVLLDPHGSPNTNTLAVGVALGGSMTWALGSVLSVRLPVPKRALVSASMQMLWVSAIFAVVATLSGEWPPTLAMLSRPLPLSFIVAFIWLIVGPGLVAYAAYLWLLRNASLTLANTYAFVNPAIAVILGTLVLGEPLTPRIVSGALIIIVAVTLIVVKRNPKGGA